MLAEIFNMRLKESFLPDYWKVSCMVHIFKNVRERYTAKNWHPVCRLFLVSEVFEKLVNNSLVDHFQKCDLFTDFQYGFRSINKP